MIIKVSTPATIQSPTSLKRKRVGQSYGDFGKLLDTEESETESVSAANPASSIDSILSLQEIGQTEDSTERQIKRGQAVIAYLEKIREGLLTNQVRGQDLIILKKVLVTEKENATDPKLQAIIAEIELRAEVELAKIEVAKGINIEA